jgi:4-hydroxythreonine-4-phosphate dehydrogenase
MGDPADIGPEIVAKVFASAAGDQQPVHAVVIGDEAIMEREISHLRLRLRIRVISEPAAARFDSGVLNLLPASGLPADLPRGIVSAAAGRAAYSYITKAIELTQASLLDGICTAPINKEALHAAGIPYPGHTEILAAQTRASDTAMMLFAPALRTILVTVHMSLTQAISQLSIQEELRVIRLAQSTLQAMGIPNPRIAVAGLNPHAGEGGLFGDEEIRIIAPAIALARQEGINASGPHSGDTVFMNARRGEFDIVVAQYHDQGLIPVKLLGFDGGVNITAGLPFVRTSPDHGTAFDIAGQGRADPSSLLTALRTAIELATQRTNV